MTSSSRIANKDLRTWAGDPIRVLDRRRAYLGASSTGQLHWERRLETGAEPGRARRLGERRRFGRAVRSLLRSLGILAIEAECSDAAPKLSVPEAPW